MEAFVSYSHADEDEFRAISQALADVGIRTFDMASLPVGSSWVEGIGEAMERADIYIVLLSKQYFESEFARFELAAAVAQSTDSGKPIMPVVVDPNLQDHEIPSLLARYTWLDMRDPEMRSAALRRLTADLVEPLSMTTTDETLTREEDALRAQLRMLEVERLVAARENLGQRRQFWTAWVSITSSVTVVVTVAAFVLTLAPMADWVSQLGVGLLSGIGVVLVERLVDKWRDRESANRESKRSNA